MSGTAERDIEETREHLGATMDALAVKADAGKHRAGIVALVGLGALVALLVWRRLS